MSEWKVSIHRRVGYWQDEIFVFKHETNSQGHFIEFMCPSVHGVEIKRFPYTEGMMVDTVPPFLRMDPREMEQFLMAWREAINGFNLPASDEMRMRGELDATKKHLEDMRTLALHPTDTEKGREAR